MGRTKGLSPTQRTLRALREEGYISEIVEKWNPFGGAPKPGGGHTGIRQDLFGVFDILSITPTGIEGVQVCGSDFAAHDRKILASEHAAAWLRVGATISLWGWRKVKAKRGGALMVWRPRIKWYSLSEFPGSNGTTS